MQIFFSKVNLVFYPPINNINHFLSSLKIVAGSPFNLAIVENTQFYVFVVLIFIYLTANGIQCLPMCLLAVHTSLFICEIFVEVLFLMNCLLTCGCSSYILNLSPLSDLYILLYTYSNVNIFSLSEAWGRGWHSS